ncbi:MAG TPA: PAS domain-containing protein, partial [Limnobacter sp.]|nr:PAS domain-containing protein [Limnobacter sp.]
RLRRHMDLQVLETKVLDLISAGEPLAKIYALITSAVDRMLPGTRSSIVLIKSSFMKLASAPGFPPEFGATVDGMPVGEQFGSCGAAAARKSPVIVTDVFTDPIWAIHHDVATRFDIRACWSVPVLGSAGDVRAAFGMYYKHVQAPADDELVFVERIVQFLRVAIERTEQHDQLKRSEERFRLVARVTSDVVWECDLKTDRIWYSEGLRTLFGHDPATDANLQTASGSAIYIHPDDLDRVVIHMQEALADKQFWQVKYRYKRKDGRYAHVVNQAYLVRDANQRPVRLIGSVKDVTEQTFLEEQLQRFQRLEAVGQMTGGLAHDFNNSLTVVLGSAERLQDEIPEDSPLRHHVDMILKAAMHGA